MRTVGTSHSLGRRRRAPARACGPVSGVVPSAVIILRRVGDLRWASAREPIVGEIAGVRTGEYGESSRAVPYFARLEHPERSGGLLAEGLGPDRSTRLCSFAGAGTILSEHRGIAGTAGDRNPRPKGTGRAPVRPRRFRATALCADARPGRLHPSGARGTGQGDRRCTAERVTMGLGRADAGAGQIYYRLTSEAPCTLRGFPGVSLIARDGGVIGAPAEREGATRAQTVIGPGKTAHVTLHTLNRGIDDSACWDPPDHLRVYPPGATEALTLRAPELRICGDRFTTTAVGG
ncbi:DUF4232 domain-containing protein [Streptomyces clavifer]|uniref:DUF4232 domain-containing protein n=1 Tax=Streptomyces clavifer TaxID=68188 RepID=UPI0036C93435